MVTSDESAPRQGFTPLHTAASHSSFQSHLVTADLLEAGAPLEAVDDEGRTPLLVALDRNRKEAIEVLIAAGMPPPHEDPQRLCNGSLRQSFCMPLSLSCCSDEDVHINNSAERATQFLTNRTRSTCRLGNLL